MSEPRDEIESWLALQHDPRLQAFRKWLEGELDKLKDQLVCTARPEAEFRTLQGQAQFVRKQLNLIATASDRAKTSVETR